MNEHVVSSTTYTNLFALGVRDIQVELWLITGDDWGLSLVLKRETNGALQTLYQKEMRSG